MGDQFAHDAVVQRASVGDIQKLRSVSFFTFSSGWPVASAISLFTRSSMRMISRASISISVALTAHAAQRLVDHKAGIWQRVAVLFSPPGRW